MTSIVLVPWGQTDWGEAGRMSTRTPMPLNESGNRQAVEWANDLAGRELAAVYCGDDPVSVAMGKLVAKRAEVRLKQTSGLDEIDVGLWEGLTSQEVEARFPKLYKRWVEEPASVCPPNGEPVGEACERVVETVHRIARKHHGGTVAIVLGPIALAATRARLELGQANGMHQMKSDGPIWYRIADGTSKPVPAGATG
jgi:broad specificity phosphatase PhoE